MWTEVVSPFLVSYLLCEKRYCIYPLTCPKYRGPVDIVPNVILFSDVYVGRFTTFRDDIISPVPYGDDPAVASKCPGRDRTGQNNTKRCENDKANAYCSHPIYLKAPSVSCRNTVDTREGPQGRFKKAFPSRYGTPIVSYQLFYQILPKLRYRRKGRTLECLGLPNAVRVSFNPLF